MGACSLYHPPAQLAEDVHFKGSTDNKASYKAIAPIGPNTLSLAVYHFTSSLQSEGIRYFSVISLVIGSSQRVPLPFECSGSKLYGVVFCTHNWATKMGRFWSNGTERPLLS